MTRVLLYLSIFFLLISAFFLWIYISRGDWGWAIGYILLSSLHIYNIRSAYGILKAEKELNKLTK